MSGFNSLNLHKSVDVPASVAVQDKKQLDLVRMIDQIAQESMVDVAGCYYSNGSIIGEEKADQALQRIKGRMQSLKALVQFVS